MTPIHNKETEKKVILRKPPWLNKKITHSGEKEEVKRLLHGLGLNTVCQSARCPNLSECYLHRRATFLILGGKCTRACGFCSVQKAMGGDMMPLDQLEPEKIGEAVGALGLGYVVITSVTRDDLRDGGAGQFARTIRKVREVDKHIKVEVLTPDFLGNTRAVNTVAEAGPDVYNHNVETVPRLYGIVRPGANYLRSLKVLSHVKSHYPEIFVKSGLMVGLGEKESEVIDVLHDLRTSGCDAVTIGQYLRPGHGNIPVTEYVPPSVFLRYKREAKALGFKLVASGPYVRSSYMAHEGYKDLIGGVNSGIDTM